MLSRQHIIDVTRSWLDTPYRHQGRKKGQYVDCVGLIVGVGAELGMPLNAPLAYSPTPASSLVLHYADQELVRMPTNEFALGRIAIMWGFDRHEAQHLAIIGERAGQVTMIHALSRSGKVVEHPWDRFWLKRLVRVYEFPNTEPLRT